MNTTTSPSGYGDQHVPASPWDIGARKPRRWIQHLYTPIKSAIEWLGALSLLILCLPLMLFLALLVKLTSKGPAFYCQRRVGKNGREYNLFKLRTMVKDAEKTSGIVWSKPGDPRITPIGRWLRTTHLDELPQLVNILCGHMSLIGPRPERPEIIKELERRYPHYRQRLRVKPGVTGLAQMLLPADTDVAGVRRKLAYDLYYVDRFSPMLDIRISISTFFYFSAEVAELWSRLAVMKHGKHVQRILDQLEREEPMPTDEETGMPSPNLIDREPATASERPGPILAASENRQTAESTAR
ncbi:MAG: sugar transferase [Tepidisphaeraceae bacterium]